MRRRYSSQVVRQGLHFPPAYHNRSDKENDMKNLRRLSVALVFALALTAPALAGDIETPFAPPPPPSQAQAQTATTDGDIETGITGQAETASSETAVNNSATEAALNLLQSVLSLF
jgi:hypothetical protein